MESYFGSPGLIQSLNSISRELELTNLFRLVLGCTSSGARPQARASGGTCPHRAKGLHRLMLPHCGVLRLRDIRKYVRDGSNTFC